MKILSLMAATLLSLALTSSCATTSSEGLATQFLVNSGMEKTGEQIIDQVFSSMSKQNTSISPDMMNQLKKEVSGKDLIKVMAPVYAKHYSKDELMAINQYTNSPVGKKSSVLVGKAMTEINAYDIIKKHGQVKGQTVMKNKLTEYLKSNLTKGEFAQMAAFEKTSAGQKMSNPTPAFNNDIRNVSQKWGMEIGSKVVSKMLRR